MKESEQLLAQGLPVLYECLKAKGQHSIEADQRRQREDVWSQAVKPQLEDPTGGHLLGRGRLVTDYANRRFVDKSARRRRPRDPINFMAVNNSNRRDRQRTNREHLNTLRDE
jgi:hypothetical protein